MTAAIDMTKPRIGTPLSAQLAKAMGTDRELFRLRIRNGLPPLVAAFLRPYSGGLKPATIPSVLICDGVATLGDVEVTRKPRPRARTISMDRLSRTELERGRQLYPAVEYDRPATRGECLAGPQAQRPCPFVSCEYHLYLDVNERTGSIKLNFPGREVWEVPESCALDVADRGGVTLEEVAGRMNLVRERVRQIEAKALARLRDGRGAQALAAGEVE